MWFVYFCLSGWSARSRGGIALNAARWLRGAMRLHPEILKDQAASLLVPWENEPLLTHLNIGAYSTLYQTSWRGAKVWWWLIIFILSLGDEQWASVNKGWEKQCLIHCVWFTYFVNNPPSKFSVFKCYFVWEVKGREATPFQVHSSLARHYWELRFKIKPVDEYL